ncbi:MAG: rhodanese-like domain-containing protein [Candidatus Sericytochromatia bacterium]
MTDALEISVQEAQTRLNQNPAPALIDVREDFEREICQIAGSQQLTEALAKTMLTTWDRNQPIIFQCHHGGRSRAAAEYFQQQGFHNVRNLTGGIDAWSLEIDPSVPRY